jgi:hypothetical protein
MDRAPQVIVENRDHVIDRKGVMKAIHEMVMEIRGGGFRRTLGSATKSPDHFPRQRVLTNENRT